MSSRCCRKTASDAAIVTIACRSNKPICIMNQDRDHTTPGTLEHAACCQQSLDGRLLLALKKWIVNRFQYLNGRFNRIECGLNFRTPVYLMKNKIDHLRLHLFQHWCQCSNASTISSNHVRCPIDETLCRINDTTS